MHWGFLIGVLLAIPLLNVVANLRTARATTRRKRSQLRSITTPLSEAAVREALGDVASEFRLVFTEATDPDRVILTSRGIPHGVMRPGFHYPVYLTPRGNGRTLVEVGAIRRVPALSYINQGYLDVMFVEIVTAIRQRETKPVA